MWHDSFMNEQGRKVSFYVPHVFIWAPSGWDTFLRKVSFVWYIFHWLLLQRLKDPLVVSPPPHCRLRAGAGITHTIRTRDSDMINTRRKPSESSTCCPKLPLASLCCFLLLKTAAKIWVNKSNLPNETWKKMQLHIIQKFSAVVIASWRSFQLRKTITCRSGPARQCESRSRGASRRGIFIQGKYGQLIEKTLPQCNKQQ